MMHLQLVLLNQPHFLFNFTGIFVEDWMTAVLNQTIEVKLSILQVPEIVVQFGSLPPAGLNLMPCPFRNLA